ncbi:GTPase IMAP family member 7-like [Engraulis encrasicolus]|uniref:GTPase IMAP family member 7-like n=1 Tax=Engraulis encrasicolus TaxID=184585 RepID=UPI002FCE9811
MIAPGTLSVQPASNEVNSVQDIYNEPENSVPSMPLDEWRLLLLGKSGTGKSSSGNTILNEEVFKSDMKLSRVTQFCERKTKIIGGRRPVTVIDTPGLFETKRSEKEVIREILQSVSLYRPGPHVFLVVIPIGRLTQEDKDTHDLLQTTFGKRVWDFTIVLFTHGDQLDGKTLNDFISNGDEELREFLRKCSGGFLVFNNKDMANREQVAKLLEKVETLVALNGNQCYRNHLYPAGERRIRERQEIILAERDQELAQKEKGLENHYKDDELERQRRALWRKAEVDARKKAEGWWGAWRPADMSAKLPALALAILFLLVVVILSLIFGVTSLPITKPIESK